MAYSLVSIFHLSVLNEFYIREPEKFYLSYVKIPVSNSSIYRFSFLI